MSESISLADAFEKMFEDYNVFCKEAKESLDKLKESQS